MLRSTHTRSFPHLLVVGVSGDGERDHWMLLGSAQLRIGPDATQNGYSVYGCGY